MADRNEQGVVKPEVVLLESLLDELAEGRLRVPHFQRPFVWEPVQMLELFDSIERGYPIGSILVWETNTAVPSLDAVSGIDVPPTPDDGPISYLLDGHQRLSTLFGTLGRRPATSVEDDRPWRIYRRLGEAPSTPGLRFEHATDDAVPTPRLLPLQAVLRTMDFLAYARRISRDPDTADDADALVDEAEELAQRIKSYKIAVIRLVGGSLSHAVEAFARLNSGGKQITPQDLVSALTYRPGVESLTDKIETVRRNAASAGFGLLEPDVVFQSIVAISDTDEPSVIRWADFATGLEGHLAEFVDRADVALARAIQFLRYEAGVPHLTLLPYSLQLPLLAAFYDRVPNPDLQHVRSLVRWFWATSWSGVLRSTTSVEYPFNLMQMRTPEGVYDLIDESVVGRARPMPEVFDARRGRVRAYLLWELQQFSQRVDLDGKVIDAVDLYVRSGTMAYRRVMDGGPQTPANYLLLPGPRTAAVASDLLKLSPRLLQTVMASHGIPVQALTRLSAGDAGAFEAARGAFLAKAERVFMQGMGVRPAPSDFADADHEA
jgi:hypothetical protein